MIGRFSAVEIIRLFLHGIFAIYPIAFFPEIFAVVGPTGIALFAVVAGLILYALPVDTLIPSYGHHYIRGLNQHVISILGLKEFKGVRSLYDVFFYEKLGEAVRYRVHWLVSLYYFYSRTFLVALIQGTLFFAIFLLLLVPSPPWSAGLIPGIVNPDLFRRSEVLLALSYTIAVVAFLKSQKGIREVADLEMALADYHQDEIREVAKVSGRTAGT